MELNKVLIVEDDSEISKIISVNVEDLGLTTEIASDGKGGLTRALTGEFSLIILDIMLPVMDGVSILKELRRKDSITPILMLTARDSELDRVLGLELGADDYMAKPFSVRELTARVKALLRRSNINSESMENREESLKMGDIKLDLKKRTALVGPKEIDLTVKEFDLLSLFMKHPGRAYSRTDLLELVWGYQFEGYEHTVNTHINRLRGKIEEDAGSPRYLKTVWGIGYRFAEDKELENE